MTLFDTPPAPKRDHERLGTEGVDPRPLRELKREAWSRADLTNPNDPWTRVHDRLVEMGI